MESPNRPTPSPKPPRLHTLLILGRVSNLPTVWSNCLAGWLLAGGGAGSRFAVLCAAASLLYLGGMFLNDACDVRFDAAHRQERPIPSGAISARAVWLWSAALLLGGGVLLALPGLTTALVTLGLVLCIVTYDLVHKRMALAPLLMAGCRFLLYLVAGSAALGGLSAKLLWCAGALAAYIVGLSFIARRESTHARVNLRCLPLLLMPIAIAVLVSDTATLIRVVPFCIVTSVWAGWSLYPLFANADGARVCDPQQAASQEGAAQSEAERHATIAAGHRPALQGQATGRTVSALLAGIVLVDMLAVQGGGGMMPLAFLALFASALILQRTIPAT
jgi:hypothetical protein